MAFPTLTTSQRLILRPLGLLLISLFFWAPVLYPAQINLTVNQNSQGQAVQVTVINESNIPVQITQVKLEMGKYSSTLPVSAPIPEHAARDFNFTIEFPQTPGSYAQIATISYLNDGRTFSLRAVGQYNFQFARNHPAQANFITSSIRQKGGAASEIVLRAAEPDSWALILPDEVKVNNRRVEGDRLIYEVSAINNGFNNTYQVYAVQTRISNGAQSLAMTSSPLKVDTMASYDRGRTSDKALYSMFATAMLLGLWMLHFNRSTARFPVALGKYAARLSFLSGGYLLIRHGAELLLPVEFFLNRAWSSMIGNGLGFLSGSYVEKGFNYFVWFIGMIRGGFLSGDLARFFTYFVDYYVIFFAIVCLPYSYFLDNKKSLDEDKYAALLKFLWYPIVFPFRRVPGLWNYCSRLGLLTLCVKFFYIPLLSSWVIGNTLYQRDLSHSFALSKSADFAEKLFANLQVITVYLQALFIYIDTTIFLFGYCVESKYLKNEMRSVEFTFFGWFFCLWCYPPFNQFSYLGFDVNMAQITTYALAHGALIWMASIGVSSFMTWRALRKRDMTSFVLLLLVLSIAVLLTHASSANTGLVLMGGMGAAAVIAVWWKHPQKARVAAALGFLAIVVTFITVVPSIPEHLSAQHSRWYGLIGKMMICAGWGAFAWASISLGFKGSNLTNRGIVTHGPYRFCRHPAYVLHILIPVVEAVMFGQYFIGLVVGYCVVYFIRAMTEERHLSHDPDYVAYKQKVPYRFIPWII